MGNKNKFLIGKLPTNKRIVGQGLTLPDYRAFSIANYTQVKP